MQTNDFNNTGVDTRDLVATKIEFLAFWSSHFL